MAWRRGLAGVEEQGTRAEGSSRNLGDLVASVREAAGLGNPVIKPLAGARPARRCDGAKNETSGGRYPQAKATKCGGTGGEKSEHPIVPRKSGNCPNGTRWREADAGAENRRGERCREHRVLTRASQRNVGG